MRTNAQQENRMLLHNATIAACQSAGASCNLVPKASIAIESGKIAWVGADNQLPAHWRNAACQKNLQGRLVTPGLIDCHTHLVFAGDRSDEFAQRLKGISYSDIAAAGGGILSTVRATRQASEDALFDKARQRLRELMAEGVTGVEIKSGYGLDEDTEVKMLRVARRLGETMPVRVRTTFLGAHALPPEYTGNRAGYVDWLCQKMIPRIAAENLADAVDAFCENIGFTPAETRRIFDAAVRHDLPVKLHADQLSDSGGAALVAEYCGLSADHVEYTSEKSVSAMAASGTVAVLLPYAFYQLQEKQTPPVAVFRRHGVPMAVATDCNPGTAPTTSLLTCLNMACIQFGLTPEEAVLGATAHAAAALDWEAELGRIEPGMRADLAVWRVNSPAQLVYWRGALPPLAARIFDGQWSDYAPPA